MSYTLTPEDIAGEYCPKDRQQFLKAELEEFAYITWAESRVGTLSDILTILEQKNNVGLGFQEIYNLLTHLLQMAKLLHQTSLQVLGPIGC